MDSGNIDGRLDLIYEKIDELLRKEKFEEVDRILEGIDVGSEDIVILLGYLTITLAAWCYLDFRHTFFCKVSERIRTEKPEEADELLRGLERI